MYEPPGGRPAAPTERTALITLGRFPKALSLARALHEGGWRVIVADPFGWHLCRVSRAVSQSIKVTAPNADPEAYLQSLCDIVAQQSVSLVIPVSEESHYVTRLAGRLPEGVTLFAPAELDYRLLHNKLCFAEHAAALQLAVPETYVLGSVRASSLAALRATYIKPVTGCSGIGVSRHEPSEGAPKHPMGGAVVQAAIAGELLCVLAVVVAGDIVALSAYRGSVFAGSVAVCFEAVSETTKVHDWVTELLYAHPDYTGFLAFDFIVDASGTPWAIECNPRLTSGLHFFEPHALSQFFATLPNDSNTAAASVPVRGGRWQWAYSTLTEAYAQLFRGRGRRFIRCLVQLFSARDVVWSLRDPLPFLLMTPLSLPILWPALRYGLTLGEASQRDIAPHWGRNQD